MVKRFTFRRLFLVMSAAGMIVSTPGALAAAFQLWEQDGASVGNYHAGIAASAEDASTAYYNPAGLVRFHNQQIVFAVDPVLTSFKYRGTVDVDVTGFGPTGPAGTVSQGGGISFVPSLNYAAPILDNLVFGFSIVSPYGLKTDYGQNNLTEYAATRTSLTVIDISPSLGLAFNQHFSVGAGLDIDRSRGEFDLVAGSTVVNAAYAPTNMDTPSENVGTGTNYGYHLGALYQFTPATRIGIAYHSPVRVHLSGTSKFTGPLANGISGPGSYQESDELKAKTTLPAVTSLSVFHTLNPTWDLMGSVSYIQWAVFNQLVFQNVAGIGGGVASNTLSVTTYENYRNSWNYSVGANYHVNDKFMIRTGLGYDETPSNNTDRNLQLPDSSRIAVALGGHYQATKALGFDMGWTHLFVMNTRINNHAQVFGDQTTTTNGSISSSADVFGFQAKWDIA